MQTFLLKVINRVGSLMDKRNHQFIADVEILKSKRIIKRDGEIADKLGYAKSVVSSYLNARVDASKPFLDKFYEAYGEYLENKVSEVPRETTGNIIRVPLHAVGGFLQGYKKKVYVDSLEHYSLSGIHGEHYDFEIEGMSMYKKDDERSAKPGDRVLCIRKEGFEDLAKNKGYVLQTIDGICYKIFDQIKGETAHFKSLNEDYDPLSFHLKEIKVIYFVDFILKKPY